MSLKRKKRVRLHLIDPGLPSVEGLLAAKRRDEYLLAMPKLHTDAEGTAVELEAPLLAVPRERVAFYEVL